MILREIMDFLVPKKHPGKIFPQICSLKKLSSSVVSGKPNSDYNIYIHHYLLIKSNNEQCPRNTRGKIPTDLQLSKS